MKDKNPMKDRNHFVDYVTNHDSPQSILSTLSINSHGFPLGLPKRSRTNGDSIPHL